jgi:hypothetical protein
MNLKIVGTAALGLALLVSIWGLILRHDQHPDSRDAQIFQLAARVAVLEFRLQQLEENSK